MVDAGSIEGPLVSNRTGAIFQVMAHFEDNPHFNQKNLRTPRSHPENFYPATALPEDSFFVVRTSALAGFQSKLSGVDENLSEAKAQLHPRAEATYLTIVGALLELMLGKSEAGRAHSIFTSQAAIIDALIAYNPKTDGISRTTLEGKFADARRRLHSS